MRTQILWQLSLTVFFLFTFSSQGAQEPQKEKSVILDIPSNVDYPLENLNLTIHLPSKIEPSAEAKQLNQRIRPSKYDFQSSRIQEISPKSRFRPIMATFAKKGLITSGHDLRTSKNPYVLREQAARIVLRVYQAILKLEEKQELKLHDIRNQDIIDLKELVDEFQKQIKMYTLSPTKIHQTLDKLLTKVNKTTGKGSIRIMGLEESDDGTTVNLIISRE